MLRRVRQSNGYEVTHAMNITGVGRLTSHADTGEDRMERGSRLVVPYFTRPPIGGRGLPAGTNWP
jgi:hypothetical protein